MSAARCRSAGSAGPASQLNMLTDIVRSEVALTNRDINVDWFVTFSDRRRAIEGRMKDGETVVVYLEFKPDSAYFGITGNTMCDG